MRQPGGVVRLCINQTRSLCETAIECGSGSMNSAVMVAMAHHAAIRSRAIEPRAVRCPLMSGMRYGFACCWSWLSHVLLQLTHTARTFARKGSPAFNIVMAVGAAPGLLMRWAWKLCLFIFGGTNALSQSPQMCSRDILPVLPQKMQVPACGRLDWVIARSFRKAWTAPHTKGSRRAFMRIGDSPAANIPDVDAGRRPSATLQLSRLAGWPADCPSRYRYSKGGGPVQALSIFGMRTNRAFAKAMLSLVVFDCLVSQEGDS